jgi:hypothetical protein
MGPKPRFFSPREAFKSVKPIQEYNIDFISVLDTKIFVFLQEILSERYYLLIVELGDEIEAEGIADSEGNYAEQILRKGLSAKKVSDEKHIEERLNRLLNENIQLRV